MKYILIIFLVLINVKAISQNKIVTIGDSTCGLPFFRGCVHGLKYLFSDTIRYSDTVTITHYLKQIPFKHGFNFTYALGDEVVSTTTIKGEYRGGYIGKPAYSDSIKITQFK